MKALTVILLLLFLNFSCSDKDNNNSNISGGTGNVHYSNTISALNKGILKINSVKAGYILYDLILFSSNYDFDLETGQLTYSDFLPLNYIKFTICLSKTTTDLNGDGLINENDLSVPDISLPLGEYLYDNGTYTNLTFTGGEFSKDDPATKLHIIQTGTLDITYRNNLYVIDYNGKDTEGVSLYCDFKGKIKFVFNKKYIN